MLINCWCIVIIKNDQTWHFGASLVAQTVKNLPIMRETQVQSLGQEDTLKKEVATHASILAWRTHGQRNLAGYSP